MSPEPVRRAGRPRLPDELRRGHRIGLRLPLDVCRPLHERATAEGQSLTAVVEELLRRGLAEAQT